MPALLRKVVFCALVVPVLASAATVVSCPANTSTGGDGLSRSFYLPAYSAGTLDTVTVNYHASTTGAYIVALEARLNAFDGTVVGTANATATVTNGTAGGTPVTFNFGNASIPAGSTIAFKQTLSAGPGSLSVNTGATPCTGTVTQTNGSTPPLDTVRRATLAITVTGNVAPVGGAGVASVPTLSQWGLMLMSGVMGLFGFAYTRRRH
ncbi:MAG: IPTL-CTERM sorting domain-containing protein [Pseudomonas putida]